ncbi:MAG: hypothetical protein K8R76_02610 [Candidatus Aegiribacteria sp.]|nr:hypothetical protein [Candidatus Aegiribacteria sp.]
MRIAAAASLFLILFISPSCGLHTVTRDSLQSQSEIYASRISFGWGNLDCFQLRGNARLQGSNLVARGPFVLWGSTLDNLLRGDFYGPDGSPVLSMNGDSTGILIYMPQDDYAVFMPGGLQTGSGTITTEDLIYLIRTGFPLLLEAWMIADGAKVDNGIIEWFFTVPDSMEYMHLSMYSGDMFPSICIWDSGRFEITASSPHDEYRAWPWKWILSINSNSVSIELTSINSSAIPWEGIWEMIVPIPVDTLCSSACWQPGWNIPQR